MELLLDKLFNFTGLKEVKNEIENLVQLTKFQNKLSFSDKNKIKYHFAFVGNPGTGKTLIAKLMCDILYSLDVISKGQFIIATKADLVSEFIGGSVKKTKRLIESASGGVLYIDEIDLLYSDIEKKATIKSHAFIELATVILRSPPFPLPEKLIFRDNSFDHFKMH